MLTAAQVEEIQTLLRDKGYEPGNVDGDFGPRTQTAVYAYLLGVPADLPMASEPPMHPGFDAGARARLAKAHPLLQRVMNMAREEFVFTILDSQRGREAQERAFRQGYTKVHYGQSAHNWDPSVALDVAPLPISWSDRGPFVALSKVILPIAKAQSIPLRWGGDWNMNGSLTDETFSDLPHYELHPWRDWARQSKPFEG